MSAADFNITTSLGAAMKSLQKGFTLIELMIVIAIIGILAAIAIPAYQNYTIRAQVTEGLSLADSFKTGVAEFYQNNGTFPVGTSVAGSATTIPMPGASAGKYAGPITVTANGNIQITYNGSQASTKVKGLILYLQPGVDTNGDVVWVCGTAATPTGVILSGAAATNVPAQYLPSSCHP
jgi:type IV pilus assembly protein PilA